MSIDPKERGMRFEESGQERPPRKGEWYMGMLGVPALAPRDFYMRSLPILRRVDDGPRSEDELERERLDREEMARQVEKREELEQKFRDQVPAGAVLRPAPPNDLRPLRETAKTVAREYLPYTDDPED